MDPAAKLLLTDKGADEIAHRTFKLGIKLRSVLLLLQHPQTVEFTVQKSVFPKEEIVGAIGTLLESGFIAPDPAGQSGGEVGSAEKPPAAAALSPLTNAPAATPVAPALTASDLTLNDEIMLSEAKFLLIDFCVDCFGMQCEKLTDDIRVSKSIGGLRVVLKELASAIGTHKPAQLITLREIVRQINETA